MRLKLIILFFSFCYCFVLNAQVSIKQDSLLQAVGELSDGPEKVRTLRDIGYNYTTTSIDSALIYFQKAITLGIHIGESVFTASTYSQMAILHNNLGNTEKADYYLETTLKMAELGNNVHIFSGYYQAATLIYKKRKNYSQALVFAKNALEYSKKGELKQEAIAGAHLNLANCYVEMKQYRQAVIHCYEALKIFDVVQSDRGRAYCHTNLATIYNNLGKYDDAIDHAKKSLPLKEKIKDEKGIAVSYNLIGNSYLGRKDYEKALSYVQKSILINTGMELNYALVENYSLEGKIFLGINDSSKAKTAYLEALRLAKDLESPILENELKMQIRQLDLSAKKSGQNLPLLLNALEIAKGNADTAEIINNLDLISKFYYEQGNFKKAFDYREDYQLVRDVVYSPDVLENLKQMESKYEIEKRENAIHLLEKDQLLKKSRIQKQLIGIYAASGIALLVLLVSILLINRNRILQRNRRKQALDTMRNNIAGDLHDDIGSTLSSIQIISKLAENQCDGDLQLKQSINRISELSTKVTESMREIVWSANPTHDTLEPIIEQMRKIAADKLGVFKTAFTFEDHIENPEKELSPAKRKELFMIYKEGLNNACKYSGSKRVDIQMSQIGNKLQMEINDNGCGFDKETITRGNGLSNMERRAGLTGSHLTINTGSGKGTTVSLEMSLP